MNPSEGEAVKQSQADDMVNEITPLLANEGTTPILYRTASVCVFAALKFNTS